MPVVVGGKLVWWHAVWPKKASFTSYFAYFFDHSAATAYKNPLRLAKNGHFFVSDATTLTSYFLLHLSFLIVSIYWEKTGSVARCRAQEGPFSAILRVFF